MSNPVTSSVSGALGRANSTVPPPAGPLFPVGIPYIVGNEGAERFSYYGMRAILWPYLGVLYAHFMSEELAGAKATAVAHLFMAAVYAFPMIGAILADRLLGKYPVILAVSLVYCAGHAVLAVAGRFDSIGDFKVAEYAMYGGLALIAAGSGGIKPCVSANVGDQFTAKNQELVSKVFQIFYFMINFGSFFSTLLTPLLYRQFGPEVAFGVPGIFMAIATVVFWFGRNKFTRIAPNPGGTLGALDFVASVLLFSPVIAVIVAVFVVGGDFKPSTFVGQSAAGFYASYVADYLTFIGARSWPYFASAAAGLTLGLVVFVVRQRRQPDAGFLAVLLHAVRNQRNRKPGVGYFEVSREKYGAEAIEGPPAVLRIMLVFSMVSVFWALFDQHASTWIAQAKAMDRAVTVPMFTGYFALGAVVSMALYGGAWIFSWVSNRAISRQTSRRVLMVVGGAGVAAVLTDLVRQEWLHVELEAAQISALNPLMVMMIIPLLNVAVYKPLSKRGITIRPLQKMTAGMFLAAVAFAIAAILQARMEALGGSAERVHVLYQVLQYIVMTTAEVLISVTGLEFAYTQAPRAMKSTIMGFWLLCVTAGNVLVAFLAPIETILSLSEFFWVFTALMVAAAFVFMFLAARYRGKSYLQGQAT